MATLNFIKRKDVKNIESLGNVIAYCAQEYKTKYNASRLISGINCLPETAMKEFIATKKKFNKTDGMQYYYAVQSFEDNLNISPLLAHQMAREWAEKCYPNHEIYIATHLDTDNIHSHIVINSVNMVTGRKIHQSTKELNQMRKINDELCIKYGLPVCIPKQKQKVKPMKAKEYYVADAGKSWKMQMILSIEYAMRRTKTKQQFIDEIDKLGYDIRWTDTRKNITYIEKANPNHRCRDNNMHQEKFLKEKMEEEFELRERLSSLEREEQEYDFHDGESSIGNDSRERLLESFDKLKQQSNQILNSILETKPDKEMIAGESEWIVQQINKKISEQESTIQKQLENQETLMTEQTGFVKESMLSESNQRKNLLNELKKKWIPIFFGTMIGIQVFFQIVSILLEIYLN